MNFLANAIAPELQWLWSLVVLSSIATGGIVWKMSSLSKGVRAVGIQGTVLSLALLGLAPTALEQQQSVEAQFAEYVELLDADMIEIYPEEREADIRTDETGAVSVELKDGYLKILTGDSAGARWYLDSLYREVRLAEAQNAALSQ